jgi:hypothetical protein
MRTRVARIHREVTTRKGVTTSGFAEPNLSSSFTSFDTRKVSMKVLPERFGSVTMNDCPLDKRGGDRSSRSDSFGSECV